MSDIAARIETLEATIAYHERTIEDLNTAITDQWKQIAELRREIANLGSQVRQIEANPALVPGEEPPPPHY